jgi:hypothetical protein
VQDHADLSGGKRDKTWRSHLGVRTFATCGAAKPLKFQPDVQIRKVLTSFPPIMISIPRLKLHAALENLSSSDLRVQLPDLSLVYLVFEMCVEGTRT